MKLLYLSASCSDKTFLKLVDAGYNHDLPQAQKYHRLLMEGLAQIENVKVEAITARPIDPALTKKKYFPGARENIGRISYRYLPLLNIPILRQMYLFLSAKKEIKKGIVDDSVIVICDIWNQSISAAAKVICKKNHVPIVGIVTDVPMHRSKAYISSSLIKNSLISLMEKRLNKACEDFDGYLFLAKAMNEVLNRSNRPYLVLEGHADQRMAVMENRLDAKRKPKVMMYAGTLHEQYGIKMLIDAFNEINESGWELHIYGKGNYVEEIKKLTDQNSRVKYWGEVSNEIIIQKETEATILVNPRPTNTDFVKYSFPSKIMEYMSTGTPVVTTELPSMPEEYKKYLFLFKEENVEGFKNELEYLCSLSEKELYIKGKIAKQFVMREKTNIVQARKLVDFLYSLKIF